MLGYYHLIADSVRKQLQEDLKVHTKHPTPTGVKLGRGMYGSVIELVLDGERVAGKVFKSSRSVLSETERRKLRDEIKIVLNLNHPSIVSSKGVCFLPDVVLPVLLMEQLKSTLYNYIIDRSKLSMEQKVSILHDVVSGLHYLHSHSPVIIHRDLTARNVLLDSELRAKISDFGNAKIIEEGIDTTTKTLEYTSIDILSFGHLALFTVLQKPIQLQPPASQDPEGKLVHGSIEEKWEKCILEAEQQFPGNQTLLASIKQCLSISTKRPHSGDLLKTLAPSNLSKFYFYSVHILVVHSTATYVI